MHIRWLTIAETEPRRVRRPSDPGRWLLDCRFGYAYMQIFGPRRVTSGGFALRKLRPTTNSAGFT